MSFRKISVSYHGRKYTVRHCPGGRGLNRDGYVSSLPQLRKAVGQHFGVHTVCLFVNSGQERRAIVTDHQLRRQFERLGRGKTLHMTASNHGDASVLATDTMTLPSPNIAHHSQFTQVEPATQQTWPQMQVQLVPVLIPASAPVPVRQEVHPRRGRHNRRKLRTRMQRA